jgi:tetratricopeptide (TPR) repeat protein
VILAQPDQALHPEAEEFFKRSSLEVEDPYMRGQARELIAQHYRLQDRFAESSAVYESYIAKFPDDEINGQLYIAQALNAQLAKDEPKFQELFAKGEAMLLALIAAELEPEAKIRKQNELATLYQAGGFIDKGIAVLREVMAANVGKAPAIQAQFAIGAMLARANRLEEAKAHFAQMQRENPGSQIAIDAEQMARMVTEREAAIAAAANDAATSPTATIPPSGSN